MSMCFLFFFFFQAEDGIRDLTVTGVQTCALPISSVEDTTTAAVPVTKPPDNVSVVGVRIFGKDGEAFVSDGTQGQAITRRVRTGDQIAGYIVKAIERTAVTLTSPSGDVVSMPLTLDAGKAQPSGPRQATPVRQPIPGRPPQPAGAQM